MLAPLKMINLFAHVFSGCMKHAGLFHIFFFANYLFHSLTVVMDKELHCFCYK